jgi:hypothetical protein
MLLLLLLWLLLLVERLRLRQRPRLAFPILALNRAFRRRRVRNTHCVSIGEAVSLLDMTVVVVVGACVFEFTVPDVRRRLRARRRHPRCAGFKPWAFGASIFLG